MNGSEIDGKVKAVEDIVAFNCSKVEVTNDPLENLNTLINTSAMVIVECLSRPIAERFIAALSNTMDSLIFEEVVEQSLGELH